MFVKPYLPHPEELPQAVQHNANGDRVILEVKNFCGITVQMVCENDYHGDMVVTLRGWGNEPRKLNNMNNTQFRATIPMEAQTACEKCGGGLEPGEACSCLS